LTVERIGQLSTIKRINGTPDLKELLPLYGKVNMTTGT
jgi:hypothetical protein